VTLEVMHRHEKLAPESGDEFTPMAPISGACIKGLNLAVIYLLLWRVCWSTLYSQLICRSLATQRLVLVTDRCCQHSWSVYTTCTGITARRRTSRCQTAFRHLRTPQRHFKGTLLVTCAYQVQLASCLINAWLLRAMEMGTDQSAVRLWHCRLNTFFY